MCYTFCSSCIISADRVCNIYNTQFVLYSLTMVFCGERKHVAKYGSTSYTNIVAIDGSSTLNFELDNIIVN
jgi:hypothetical protein